VSLLLNGSNRSAIGQVSELRDAQLLF
jgi:hypothetical protein